MSLEQKIGLLKDISSILFSLITTTVIILTYRQAKMTIFRSEVVKKQNKILTKLFLLIRKNRGDINYYERMVVTNLMIWLKRYGFITKTDNKLEKQLRKNVVGAFVSKKGARSNYELIEPFVDETKKKSASQIGKNEYLKAKKGKIEISEIFITKEYRDYENQLETFLDNPFLPTAVKTELSTYMKNLHTNMTLKLTNVLKSFFLQLFKRYKENKGKVKFSATGVYNQFNHKKINNKDIINEILMSIRRYLKVDSL